MIIYWLFITVYHFYIASRSNSYGWSGFYVRVVNFMGELESYRNTFFFPLAIITIWHFILRCSNMLLKYSINEIITSSEWPCWESFQNSWKLLALLPEEILGRLYLNLLRRTVLQLGLLGNFHISVNRFHKINTSVNRSEWICKFYKND